ncbi:MAG: NAD-dependent deacylase [Prevotellaceae bacterium]|jgi:NAD-dependent deacetylase|nr:NAD-dependent deacylase [Prevotellaceae bacterium]
MKKLVVLSGAGISAESGIRTFRDSDGLWEKYRIEDVATPEGWRRNQQLVTDFYNQRRKQLLEVEPNFGHIGLAELEKDFDVQIITQNVDNLHEKAGSTKVIHLHGELTKVRSERYENLIYDLSPDKYEIKIGDLCEKGYQLRPHIVWFGEAVPLIEKAAELVSQADILAVIGTSLSVYPAAGLLYHAPMLCKIYYIDPKGAENLPNYVNFIKKGAAEGVKELQKILRDY